MSYFHILKRRCYYSAEETIGELGIGDIKGIFYARMGMIKDRNGKDLIEEEEIKKK